MHIKKQKVHQWKHPFNIHHPFLAWKPFAILCWVPLRQPSRAGRSLRHLEISTKSRCHAIWVNYNDSLSLIKEFVGGVPSKYPPFLVMVGSGSFFSNSLFPMESWLLICRGFQEEVWAISWVNMISTWSRCKQKDINKASMIYEWILCNIHIFQMICGQGSSVGLIGESFLIRGMFLWAEYDDLSLYHI